MIMRGEQMLALHRQRMADAHLFLLGAFRPLAYGPILWRPRLGDARG